MKVSQAIEMLSKCNPDAMLISYSADTEDASATHSIEENGERYCKGGTCEEIANGKPYVVIG